MSAFKKLDRRDVFTTAHLAKKSWSADSASIDSYGIEVIVGTSGSNIGFPGDQSIGNLARYGSLRHLFYSNFLSSSLNPGINTGSFENYLQSSFNTTQRYFGTAASAISFPKSIIGEGLEPGTFSTATNTFYIYDEPDYVLETVEAGGDYIEDGDEGGIIDDGEGRLVIQGAARSEEEVGQVVGNIFYPHGLAIFTDDYYSRFFSDYDALAVDWTSRYTVFTTNYSCKVRDEELNFSLNPSSMKDSFGNIADNLSGSEFKPYVTTIGLYNDDQELIAVAKLGQPIPKSTNTDMTFVVKLDI